MKKEIKDKWIEALRSGKYQQGKYYLKTYDNKFCCLGVLCDISGQDEWAENNHYLYEEETLPEVIMDWAGIKTDNGTFKDKTYLTSLNDNGKSFEEIADIIEKYWEEL